MENKKEEKKPDIQQETVKFLKKKVIVMNEQNQLFYKYDPEKGYHYELTENQLQREVDSYLNSGDSELSWSLSTINRVIATATIKVKAYDDFDSDPDCIVLKNGVLDTKTKELHKFTPNLHATAGLSFPYQPDATCPTYEKFKSDVCCGDSDMMQDLDSILGLALVGDTKAAKGILLAGTGSNGKSTFLSLLSEFIPEKYITNMSISAINSKRDFDRHALASSRVNILHELDKKPTLDGMFSNNVKALITGDDLSAEIKGGIRYNKIEKYKVEKEFRCTILDIKNTDGLGLVMMFSDPDKKYDLKYENLNDNLKHYFSDGGDNVEKDCYFLNAKADTFIQSVQLNSHATEEDERKVLDICEKYKLKYVGKAKTQNLL